MNNLVVRLNSLVCAMNSLQLQNRLPLPGERLRKWQPVSKVEILQRNQNRRETEFLKRKDQCDAVIKELQRWPSAWILG